MAQQVINIGLVPNDGTGDALRVALDKTNTNFKELYEAGATTSVQPNRLVSAGTGLTGGGSLAADRTLALSAGTIASLALADAAVQPEDIGTAALQDSSAFATAVQGGKADTAVQPGALGTAATRNDAYFASAAQGLKADNSVQQNGTFNNIGAPAVPGTSYIDAYTSGGNRDYDVRIEFSGGSSLRDGQGLANILGRLYQRYDPYYSTALGTPFNINEVIIGGTTHNDDVDVGGAFVSGQVFSHYFGGTNAKGGRQAHAVYAYLSQPTNAANPNRNYVGVTGVATAQTNDTGANTTLAGSAGALFGGGFVGAADTGATNLANVTGAEFNTAMHAGSSAYAKSLAQFSGRIDDVVAGAVVNSMLWFYNQAGAVKWTNGLHFLGGDGVHEWPFSEGGFIVKAEGGPTGTGWTVRDDGFLTGRGYQFGNIGSVGSPITALELGTLAVGDNPYIDIKTLNADYDVRLQFSGGSAGSSGQGTFGVTAAKILLNILPPAFANDAAASAGGVAIGQIYASSSFGNCLTVRRV